MPMSVVSYLIMSLSGMKIVSKGKYQESDTNFLEKLYKVIRVFIALLIKYNIQDITELIQPN